jgi:hypothetical protein
VPLYSTACSRQCAQMPEYRFVDEVSVGGIFTDASSRAVPPPCAAPHRRTRLQVSAKDFYSGSPCVSCRPSNHLIGFLYLAETHCLPKMALSNQGRKRSTGNSGSRPRELSVALRSDTRTHSRPACGDEKDEPDPRSSQVRFAAAAVSASRAKPERGSPTVPRGGRPPHSPGPSGCGSHR